VDVAMSQCSSHDVANLLKQFLRELPIPLLGFEYIDTFFEVAGKVVKINGVFVVGGERVKFNRVLAGVQWIRCFLQVK